MNLTKLINRIKQEHPDLRQDSKSPTFLLQFLGTVYGLMRQFGFSKKQSEHIYNNYIAMYQTSIKWCDKQIKKAFKRGYVVGAFNLRLHTPLLKQSVYKGSSNIPEVSQEIRTATNMLGGQSYGLLTIVAFAKFMRKVKRSKYRLQIIPVVTIYDSIYLMLPDDPKIVAWVNKWLIYYMLDITNTPELKHDIVKLETELELFYPSWAYPTAIPNGASVKEITQIIKKAKKDESK